MPLPEFWIDVGGTFTDCIMPLPDGALATHKLLSSATYKGEVGAGPARELICDARRAHDPNNFFEGFRLRLLDAAGAIITETRVARSQGDELHFAPLAFAPAVGTRYELKSDLEAPIVGIRYLLQLPLTKAVGPCRVRIGTTRATNALLERQGAPTAFVTTRGFGDILHIGTGDRPRLFDLHVRQPEQFVSHFLELPERLAADGRVLRELDAATVRQLLTPLKNAGVTSLAVCLLHAPRHPAHELLVEQVARELNFEHVSLSHRLSALPGLVARAQTTALDAYLSPVLRAYCESIQRQLPHAEIRWMTSAGALTPVERFSGRDAILSGPCGGVVGVAQVAREANFTRVIGFDMGGTSSDVSRWDGEFERRYEMEVRDPQSDGVLRVVAPMLRVETVAAGGGSICTFDGQKLQVGPRSAGSDPGPACYGRGGPLCVTDLNLFLGRLLPRHFPFPLDRDAICERLDELREQIEAATSARYERDDLALGLLKIANANMVAPIRHASLGRGFDPRDHALLPFGGGGAQHACALARELGITQVLCHPHAGLLSALGIGQAPVSRFAERAVGRQLNSVTIETTNEIFRELQNELQLQLQSEGIAPNELAAPRCTLEMCYAGQQTRLSVPCAPDADVPDENANDLREEFERRHETLYGFTFPQREIEVYALRLELLTREREAPIAPQLAQPRRPEPTESTLALFDDGRGRRETAVWERSGLEPGDELDGPAIITESASTIVIEPNWSARVTEHGNILLTSHSVLSSLAMEVESTPESIPDPVELELFNNAFTSIAAQMGTVLQKTATSTNVKERLDFSCGVFDGAGELIVNAPHIPVHLGAMSECVKCLMADVGRMRPGDVWISNDPFRGGSHLPDVTVVTPVFIEQQSTPQFYVASRAHHAEIGGVAPGSMSPFAKTLAEEGVLIRAFALARDGRSREDELRQLLSSGPYPSRAVAENIADLNAQAAANRLGARLLAELCRLRGNRSVAVYMNHIRTAAETKIRATLKHIAAGSHRFEDALDDGSKIRATITIRHTSRGGEASIDFAGTDPVLPSSLNANRAIVTSCVLYCLRCLLNEDIPLNAGVLAPVEILLPEGCFLNPAFDFDPAQCPAVAGGNVETSQRVVDVLLGALGVTAASQGTMNNVLFGRGGTGAFGGGAFGYYETIGGGTGAGPNFSGAHAVHSHMTNTRLTDPEILELRYPVRLLRCAVRSNSGGKGKYSGGDGMMREWEFLDALEVSLLTSRRAPAPYGVAGGGPGAAGRNRLRRSGDADFHDLPAQAFVRVFVGDVLRLETPGGGGWGREE